MDAYVERPRVPCECCGSPHSDHAYGEADRSGHVWTHHVCEHCRRRCSSDEDGNPIHMLPGWDGSPDTFEAFRA